MRIQISNYGNIQGNLYDQTERSTGVWLIISEYI